MVNMRDFDIERRELEVFDMMSKVKLKKFEDDFMKIQSFDDIKRFIDDVILAHQFKWGIYIFGGAIVLILFLFWFMGQK